MMLEKNSKFFNKKRHVTMPYFIRETKQIEARILQYLFSGFRKIKSNEKVNHANGQSAVKIHKRGFVLVN